jgi:hypothetical protein
MLEEESFDDIIELDETYSRVKTSLLASYGIKKRTVKKGKDKMKCNHLDYYAKVKNFFDFRGIVRIAIC